MVALVVIAYIARQPRWRHDDGDHDDGDHGVAPVTRRSCRCFGDGDQEARDDGHIMSLMNCM